MIPPLLVIAIGNESRGDDALAPLLIRQLQSESSTDQIEFIEDFQLQVEHVTDLLGRNAVLFIDADMSCEAPFHISSISAAHDNSYTSHAMTPFAVLHTFRQVYGSDAPPCFLLRVRGYGFELGEGLSAEAQANLLQATGVASAWLAEMVVSPSPCGDAIR
ncbi:MAG: hydrogenase maturation protease [Gammaproteobacteria bacterium]|nr:hydrogenase maturation protease [Gammaproteobacteria bacterium]MBU1775432.1 hydrogenase maturation protease [Gammaproteobacteria bacterium]MBU1968804.1 hydrogenase maturation protease [Gammaproteobacteria bacterium]